MIHLKILFDLDELIKKQLDNEIAESKDIELKQRLMIVKLLTEGAYPSMLAKLFNKSETTVKKYFKMYNKGGIKAFESSKPNGRIGGFVICIKNDNYPVSLEKGKAYQIIFDAQDIKYQLIRVIDESGEDYLYPQDYFIPISLPLNAAKALINAE